MNNVPIKEIAKHAKPEIIIISFIFNVMLTFQLTSEERAFREYSPPVLLCAGYVRLFVGALRERTKFEINVNRNFVYGRRKFGANQVVSPIPT